MSEISTPKIVLLKLIGVTSPRTVTTYLDDYFLKQLPLYLTTNWTDPSLVKLIEGLRKLSEQTGESVKECPQIVTSDDPEAVKSSIVLYCEWAIRAGGQNKVNTSLNDLQGSIWSEGYKEKTIKIPTYSDVEPSFDNWRKADIKLWSLSSGSIEGQTNFFKCSQFGDLSNYFHEGGHISTTSNGLDSQNLSCYTTIAKMINESEANILFLTACSPEAKAAKLAGLTVGLVEREEVSSAEKSAADEDLVTIKDLSALQFEALSTQNISQGAGPTVDGSS